MILASLAGTRITFKEITMSKLSEFPRNKGFFQANILSSALPYLSFNNGNVVFINSISYKRPFWGTAISYRIKLHSELKTKGNT
jgi:hypothetical protein